MWPEVDSEYFNSNFILRTIAGLLCFCLLVKEYWNRSFQRYFRLFWSFTLIYCLPFLTVYMFMSHAGSNFSAINLALALFLLAMLTNWQNFISFAATGIFSAYWFWSFNSSVGFLEVFKDNKFNLIYICVFSSLLGIIFSRHRDIQKLKEERRTIELSLRNEKLEKENAIMQERYDIARSVSHDIMTPAVMLRMLLRKDLSKITDDERELLEDALVNLSGIVDSILPGVRTRYENLSESNLNVVVKKCVAAKRFMHKTIEMQIVEEEDAYAKIDSLMLVRVIANLINNSVEAMRNTGPAKLIITVGYDKFGNAKIVISDNGKGMPKSALDKIAITQASFGKQNGFGIGLYESKKVVNSWNGDIIISSEENQGTTVTLLFPGQGVGELIFDESVNIASNDHLYDPKMSNTFVLLDANEDYCRSCVSSAEKLSINLSAFSSQKQLFDKISKFATDACFFIEYRRDSAFDAVHVARKLYKMGYKNLVFITNFAPDVPKLHFIKRIFTKDLPILN